MHVLAGHLTGAGRLSGSVGTRLADILPWATAKNGIVNSCRPLIRSLGMSDKPWGAILWIAVAAGLAILFVITFFLVEGSMWT